MPNNRIFIVLLAGLFGALPPHAPASMPGKVDLTAEFARFGLIPQNQGADTCSLHAVASLAEFELARVTQDKDRRRSTEFLIWAAKKATGKKQNQAMFYEAVHGLNTLGICRETLMPEEEEKSHGVHPPSAAAIADAKKESHRWKVHWIRRWSVVRPMEDAQLTAIEAALVHGHPVACGLRWPKTLKGYEVIQVPPPRAVEDGHSIALVGYLHDSKQGPVFIFRNSWGPRWGKNGYGIISQAYVRAYANDALWLELGLPHSEVPSERLEAESAPVLASGRCHWNVQDMAPFERRDVEQGQAAFLSGQGGWLHRVGHERPQAGHLSTPRWRRRRPITARSTLPWTDAVWPPYSISTADAFRPPARWNWATSTSARASTEFDSSAQARTRPRQAIPLVWMPWIFCRSIRTGD